MTPCPATGSPGLKAAAGAGAPVCQHRCRQPVDAAQGAAAPAVWHRGAAQHEGSTAACCLARHMACCKMHGNDGTQISVPRLCGLPIPPSSLTNHRPDWQLWHLLDCRQLLSELSQRWQRRAPWQQHAMMQQRMPWRRLSRPSGIKCPPPLQWCAFEQPLGIGGSRGRRESSCGVKRLNC